MRQLALDLESFEHANDPFRSERGINCNGERFSIKVINEIEGPKPRAMIQGIAHEVRGPHFVQPLRYKDRQRGPLG